MGALRPQPKTRQRALLKAWGFDEAVVLDDGIDARGIMVIGIHDGRGTVYLASDNIARTRISYESDRARDEMMKAREDDWNEYVKSLGESR